MGFLGHDARSNGLRGLGCGRPKVKEQILGALLAGFVGLALCAGKAFCFALPRKRTARMCSSALIPLLGGLGSLITSSKKRAPCLILGYWAT